MTTKSYFLFAATFLLAASNTMFGSALHGYCATQCIDNGANSPTTNDPITGFGFTSSPGGASGDLLLEILVPDNLKNLPTSYSFTGTLDGTAALDSSTNVWNSGNLQSYLGISGGPSNPIGAFLPSTQALDSGATGFYVYSADLGDTRLGGQSESLATTLPQGSYIVAYLNIGDGQRPDWIATANSGAIFETGNTGTTNTSVTPEPGSTFLAGLGLIALGMVGRSRSRS